MIIPHHKRIPYLNTEYLKTKELGGVKQFDKINTMHCQKEMTKKAGWVREAGRGQAQSPSAVRIIKSIQEQLNVQGSGVAGIVVLWSQTLESICLMVCVSVREKEREEGEGETRVCVQTSDSHYLISALRDRLRLLQFQQAARTTEGWGTIPLLQTIDQYICKIRCPWWKPGIFIKYFPKGKHKNVWCLHLHFCVHFGILQ